MMHWQMSHPGTVGISAGAADRLLDALESCGTEPHALLVMRHGSPVFEGYWAPYAPGIIHGDQSLTKTVTGIALGVAITEGILHLDDRLIDIFPEFAHHTQGRPWWDQLRVRHIATMGAGMERQPPVTDPDWIEKFFQMDIVHAPGSAFYYNSIACSMVGACIRKRTGLGLMDYLTPRVFNKLGIDVEHLRWHKHPDGMENGSGGLISTVRDNALMMELYRRDGIWEGERILCPEWVDFALHVQNPHTDGATYGGMMWIYPGFVMADGAMGQWSMLFPEKDMVISIQETIVGGSTCDRVRKALTSFVDTISDTPQSWTEEEIVSFQRRLRSLSLPVLLVALIEAAIAANLCIPYFTNTTLPFVAPILISTIQLGSTVDYAILMTTKYLQNRRSGQGRKEAVGAAVASSAQSILVSGLSFFAATFGVGLYSNVDIISSMCSLMARGALCSVVVVLFLLPAVLLMLDKVIVHSTLNMKSARNVK